LAATVTAAQALEICGDMRQGELFYIRGNPMENTNIFNNLDKKSYFSDKQGITLVALHRNAPKEVKMVVYAENGSKTSYELEIAPAQWDIQRVEGVQPHHVAPSKTHAAEIAREQKDVNRALAGAKGGGKPAGAADSYSFWSEGFILPVEGRISGHFGNQRIFNGVPKSPHSGTDIAAPEGTPVKASAAGKVVLSGKDYFYTGNMVIIDHGHQLQTIYAHLKDATVVAGDDVRQGDIIGHVGKTGRATGPHLHWGASLNNVRFRPHSLLNLADKKCRNITGKYMGE
jgi:murein DD-endopeptidase MepM/ murein hydrolase activator NlpD